MHLAEDQNFPRESPEIFVVGGGKGGVGKTCFAVNMAVEIARKGWQVIVVDADLSCANVSTVLGVRTDTRLDDFFHQRGGKDLCPVTCPTAYPNLRVIPGTTGLLDVANPRYQKKMAFIRELRQLEADLVIVDLDAGAHLNTLDFFLLTDNNGVLVITPEKTSIDNAFTFLRAALFRRIERFYQSPEVALLLKRNETLSEFIDCVYNSVEFEESVRRQICRELVGLARGFKPKIVVNKASNAYEAQIAANILSRYVRRYLKIEPEKLGFVYFDKCVSESVNVGEPFVVSRPKKRISLCIADIANRLGYV